ncbi:MAG: cobalt-precorrin-6A reductase [Pseudomonadota bacterium]
MKGEARKILLLAGTAEAREIAEHLVHDADYDAVASLAGSTRDPDALPLPTRIGGFGSAQGFANYLTQNGVAAVIDATHPFAWRISARSAEICTDLGVPYLQVLRPPWQAGPGDNWIMLANEEEAAQHARPPETVFLATGRRTLERFAVLKGCRIFCRRIDRPRRPFPFPGGQYLIGRPPFSVADEKSLFRRLGIDWLVVKNAGGASSRSKLDAAAELGLPVLMVKRPPQPDAPRVETATGALSWMAALG